MDTNPEPADVALAMMDDLARAAWTIVTRMDTLFDDSGDQTGTEGVSLLDTLPAPLQRRYRDLRFRVLDISTLDGWASGLIPLSDVTW